MTDFRVVMTSKSIASYLLIISMYSATRPKYININYANIGNNIKFPQPIQNPHRHHFTSHELTWLVKVLRKQTN